MVRCRETQIEVSMKKNTFGSSGQGAAFVCEAYRNSDPAANPPHDVDGVYGSFPSAARRHGSS